MKKTELTSMFLSRTKSLKTATLVRVLQTSFLLALLFGWASSVSAQCTLSCNSAAQVSLPGPGADCEATITHAMVMTSSLLICTGTKTVIVYDGAGGTLPSAGYGPSNSFTGALVDEAYEGQVLTVKVVDDGTGNECWGAIKIEDKLGPSITNCNDTTLYCVQDPRPVSEGGEVIDPTFDDCMGVSTLIISHTDQITNGTCADPFSSMIRRTWVATDVKGNSTSCVQTITLDKVTLASTTPVCPMNVEIDCTDPDNLPSFKPEDLPVGYQYPTVLLGTETVNVVPGASAFCALAASYSDEEYDLCGVGKKILRTWTIYDWCTPIGPGNPWTCIQVIKFEDETDPVIVGGCGDPVYSSTDSYNCHGDVALPSIRTRDCSDVNVQISSIYGVVNDNGGVIENVPAGTHLFTYTATDDCGNSTSCSKTVIVEDNVPPVAVCDEHTVVSLTNDGTGIAYATTFNDGSSDNCEIDRFEVRRMVNACKDTTYFDEYETFFCCDIGTVVMVTMRVYDKAGNYNECMVEVEVQDKLPPVVTCPPDKTVDCSFDLTDLSSFGDATATDNCDSVRLWTRVDRDVDNCGVGTITRWFIGEDMGGRLDSCGQVITVINDDPFEEDDITWPEDYNTTVCGASFDPDDIPCDSILWCRPEYRQSNCGLIAVTYTDQELPINNACRKVLRRWVVIDWCQYDPNASYINGYWSHTQILKALDEDAPVLTCPMDTVTIEHFDADCKNILADIPPVTATDCSNAVTYEVRIDYNNNGRIDSIMAGNDASGRYEGGTHRLVFVASDGCGNSSFCEVILEIIDRKKPTPICFNGLSATLMPNGRGGGMVRLTPMMFNNKSFDNCTPEAQLKYVLTPRDFTCDDLGPQLVRLEVTDRAGNSDYCETFVDIQDNMGVCTSLATSRIGGAIKNANDEGVQGVQVDLNIGNSMLNTYTTTADGMYMFDNLQDGFDYSVTPRLNADLTNGVSTYDLVLISKHVLNVERLDSPYKIIAADANRTGNVSTLDLVAVRKAILRVTNEYPNNTSWRFVDRNHVFTDPTDPLAQTFPEVMNYNNLQGVMDISDFIAIKVGDVSGDATPNDILGVDDRTLNGTTTFATNDQTFTAGQNIAVPVTADELSRIVGYQFTMEFDNKALQLADIEMGEVKGMSKANFGLTMVNDGIITTSWDNSKTTLNRQSGILFTLHFQTTTSGTLSELLNITSQYTEAEAYQTLGGSNIESQNVTLRFNESQSVNTGFALYQNKPNPFSLNTVVGFQLPEADNATLTIYDLSGKVVKVVSGEFAKGHNQIRVSNTDIAATGVLYYRLETSNHTATRKMILVK